MVVQTSNNATRVQHVTPEEYLAAQDFLARMYSEQKQNDTNIELFALLFGERCYELIVKQGYFSQHQN